MDQVRNNKKMVGEMLVSREVSARRAAPVPPPVPEPKTTTRVELLDAVYNACPTLSRAQAREIFEMTLDEIVGALVRDEPVKLRSFGAFTTRTKRERVGRNPRTGVEAKITARRVLTFKASPTLVSRINGEVLPEDED
jgi:integration host factor subunit alpha